MRKIWRWLLWGGIVLLPKKWVSRGVGALVRIPLPQVLIRGWIGAFSKLYGVNWEEVEVPEEGFRTFLEFFTRPLKPNARPISELPLVLPCDGKIYQKGNLQEQRSFWVKGSKYTLEDLLGETPEHEFHKGWAITVYLSPKDYHRVHSPADVEVKRVSYLPGERWPVNPLALEHVPNLFARNERVAVWLQTTKGLSLALIMVGALNVGSIRLYFDENFSPASTKKSWEYSGVFLRKGEALGCFEMGSTVILVGPPAWELREDLEEGDTVKMGEGLGQQAIQKNDTKT